VAQAILPARADKIVCPTQNPLSQARNGLPAIIVAMAMVPRLRRLRISAQATTSDASSSQSNGFLTIPWRAAIGSGDDQHDRHQQIEQHDGVRVFTQKIESSVHTFAERNDGIDVHRHVLRRIECGMQIRGHLVVTGKPGFRSRAIAGRFDLQQLLRHCGDGIG
jgi:hypothetical protein